jgi:hypothetical protein
MNKTIAELYSIPANEDIVFMVSEPSGRAGNLSLDTLKEQIKAELGYYKNPLKKCRHCGQWGAVMCECVKCGAPIDP